MAFSPDGQRIVTGSNDNTAKVWEAATAEQVATWQKEEKEASEGLQARARELADAAERERSWRARDPGAIKQWLLLLPISVEHTNGATALAQQQIPDEANPRARANEAIQVGQSEMVWQAVHLDDYLIDFNRVVGSRGPWSVAYAVCYIESAATQTNLSMKLGSHDQSKVYLNGKEIYRSDWARTYVPNQDSVEGVELKAGLNVLVFKVVNEEGDWRGSIRLTDAAGQPVKGIRVTLDPGKQGKHQE